MSATIYYFTSTGNSLQIARIVSKELGTCVIKPITALPHDEPVGGEAEYIGFTFPVFNFGLPRLVKDFIEKLDILPGTYCFALICYGGYGANTLGMLEDILALKGIRLSYADGVVMPKSNASAPEPEKINQIISAASAKMEKAAKDIASGMQRPIKRKAAWLSKTTNRWLYKNIAEYDKDFIVTDQCISCGLCVSLCPVNNIILDGQKPLWLHHCERCLRCLQWCPKEAIQYGQKTVKWRRYRNPGIQVTDLYNSRT